MFARHIISVPGPVRPYWSSSCDMRFGLLIKNRIEYILLTTKVIQVLQFISEPCVTKYLKQPFGEVNLLLFSFLLFVPHLGGWPSTSKQN